MSNIRSDTLENYRKSLSFKDADRLPDVHIDNSNCEILDEDAVVENESSLLERNTIIAIVVVCCLSMVLMVVIIIIKPDDHFDLSQSNTFLTPPPKDINRFCETQFISTFSGFSLCEQMCQAADCCLLDNQVTGSCKDQNPDACAQYYQLCKPIFENNSFSLDFDRDDIIDMSNLDNICSSASLSTESGRAMCFDACRPALCCFESNTNALSCLSNQTKSWCDMFSKCEIIIDSSWGEVSH